MKIFFTVPLLVLAIAATNSTALSLEVSSLARRAMTATQVEQNQDSSEDSSPGCDSEDGKIICPE